MEPGERFLSEKKAMVIVKVDSRALKLVSGASKPY